MALSWKAVRRGRIYCAPACGAGCTFDAYTKALKEATALAKRLNKVSEGWKPVVHENLGWHWRVSKGKLDVHKWRSGEYGVFLQTSPQIVTSGPTPEAAVHDAIVALDNLIKSLQKQRKQLN